MGVRERNQIVAKTTPGTIEISSVSSYSSNESLNVAEFNLINEQQRQNDSRRNLKGWLRKNKKQLNCRAPVAESHVKISSTKNSRRAERLKGQLSCLAEIKEDVNEEGKALDIYSFVDSSATTFTTVVTDPNLLQDWNETFIHSKVRQSLAGNSVVTSDECLGELESTYDWCTDIDHQRKVNTSAQSCYRRIGKHARNQLKMPHKQHEALTQIEQELLDWFSVFPDSVMIKCMKSPYERLLFHSVCRYFNLSSYSVSSQGGPVKSMNTSSSDMERKTYVQNNLGDQFHPPELLLSQYLSKLNSSTSTVGDSHELDQDDLEE